MATTSGILEQRQHGSGRQVSRPAAIGWQASLHFGGLELVHQHGECAVSGNRACSPALWRKAVRRFTRPLHPRISRTAPCHRNATSARNFFRAGFANGRRNKRAWRSVTRSVYAFTTRAADRAARSTLPLRPRSAIERHRGGGPCPTRGGQLCCCDASRQLLDRTRILPQSYGIFWNMYGTSLQSSLGREGGQRAL